ncbi:MMB_0454 family protein [Metamycoplasma spumans]|uniref:MMB_0454 family protein n=1 Tax=Metamycoplasma spumans TaxID=92406 RepID=UPI0004837493
MFVIVNTKMNFNYKVELCAIEDSIMQIFKNEEGIQLVDSLKIDLNNKNSNVDISLKYKLNSVKNFSFETKKLIFLIEQKVFSLINTKPNNINLIFEGTFNEK